MSEAGSGIASTPSPPYVAVIFSSVRAPEGERHDDGYGQTAEAMYELARHQEGFLGFESARDFLGISISYWRDEASARAWKGVGEHLLAQRRGRQEWYAAYRVRVATVTRDYGWAGRSASQPLSTRDQPQG